jgi:hypothetical protein
MDVPYESKRYKHVSITVQDDGQIQQIDEAEAGFRLASISKAPPRNGGLPAAAPSGTTAAATAAATPSKQTTARKRKRAGGRQASAAAAPPPAAQLPRRLWTKTGRWILAIGTMSVLTILLAIYQSPFLLKILRAAG